MGLPGVAHYAAVLPVYRPILWPVSTVTQCDAVIQADVFRNTTGFDGTGVQVGVLSDSVNEFTGADGKTGVPESQATKDLPAAGVKIRIVACPSASAG